MDDPEEALNQILNDKAGAGDKAGIARVEDLRRDLRVSLATVRRDLETLEEEGRVRRVHGGAVSMESRLEEAMFDD